MSFACAERICRMCEPEYLWSHTLSNSGPYCHSMKEWALFSYLIKDCPATTFGFWPTSFLPSYPYMILLKDYIGLCFRGITLIVSSKGQF